jgi:anionic cell wall polymer biosynthesis LytR-Cps2A-Psr (LCP) family protein
MFRPRFGAITLGKAGYLLTCLVAAVVLVLSGYAHSVVTLITRTGSGAKISNSPSIGPMNVLVMGLESRIDYRGQELDHHLQHVMHIGSNGSQDTNTLILLHIFAGGQQAVGFSISRDDLVTYPKAYYPGITRGKIDAAYHWAFLTSMNDSVNSGMSLAARNLEANKAGQLATVQTVAAVAGVKIDHFIELNLFGFYYVASAFNGMEVCIMPYQGNHGLNLTDYDPFAHPPTDNSGFNAYQDGYNKAKGGQQYLDLNPAQSLAFVRSRDTLPGTDLGRTWRQQATIDYAIWKLKHDGTLSDFATLTSLLGNLGNVLITDQGFKLIDFATEMRALTGKHMTLITLPYGTENGVPLVGYPNPQDVNIIDPAKIKREVQDAFYPRPPASTQSVDVRVMSAADAAHSPTPAPSTTAAATDGGVNSPVTVAPNAPYGIPCVY